MSAKETFIIRTEWYEAISELSDSDKLTLFDNLFHYHMGNSNLINLDNLTVKLVWKLIEPSLVRNIENYDKRRETSARNGALGGRPKREDKPNNNLNKPNQPDGLNEKPNNHDSVSVYVSDSVLDNDSDLKEKEIIENPLTLVYPFSSVLFLEKWNLLITTPKWKVKKHQSLQISLDTLAKYDEPFSIEMINQAIAGEWSMFKGFELDEYYKKYKASKKAPKASKKNDEEKQSFETFWNLYDKKVGKKEKLVKKWDSLNLATQNQILEYLPKYIKAVPDKQFRKNPETFLNNDGWNDEIVEISDKPKAKPLVDVKAIEIIKNTEEQKSKAKQLKEIVQKRVLDKLKSDNPNYSITEDFNLWDSSWKNEYVAECKALGMDKVIYENW